MIVSFVDLTASILEFNYNLWNKIEGNKHISDEKNTENLNYVRYYANYDSRAQLLHWDANLSVPL